MGLFDFSFGFSKSSGGGTNVPQTKDLMQFQSDQWRGNTEWFNKNGYKYLREGLIAADYNPILAIGASPLDGSMPNATAVDGTRSSSFNLDGAATSQAATAKKIADSQIALNNSNASKADEEALTEKNRRNNLDAQTALNNIRTIWETKSLPIRLKQLMSSIELIDFQKANYEANTAKIRKETEYIPKNYELENNKYEFTKDVNVQEQKYREEHPIYNFVDRWSKALSPWAMPAVIGTTAGRTPTSETIYTEKANFDKNGIYKGHSRTTTRKSKGR